MPKIYSVKSREVYKVLEKLNFYLDHTTGSHKIFKNTDTNQIITVPAHNKDLKIGTVKSIIRMTNLTQKEFLNLL
jgi:predicted RNA binding protein YcfA (HicA-like mRNA interferase family)